MLVPTERLLIFSSHLITRKTWRRSHRLLLFRRLLCRTRHFLLHFTRTLPCRHLLSLRCSNASHIHISASSPQLQQSSALVFRGAVYHHMYTFIANSRIRINTRGTHLSFRRLGNILSSSLRHQRRGHGVHIMSRRLRKGKQRAHHAER